MPRIRSIKHDFFVNEDLGALSFEARLLFIGLWTIADREGRLEDRPVRIKGQILPYDEQIDADALLAQLADRNFIIRYTAEGKRFIQICRFTRHQKPHPKEPASDIPAPNDQFPEPASEKLPCVYFVQAAGGLIKIGTAQNVETRLKELQTGCPVKLEVMGVIAGSVTKEKELHAQFSHLRQAGEWFDAAPDLLEFIEQNAYAVKLHGKKLNAPKERVVNGYRNGSSVNGNGNGDKSIVDSDESTAHKISHSRSALATEVFEYWRTELGKNGTAKFDVKRRRLVEARLADNDVEFIKQAIRGIKHSAFHMGENEQHKVYDGLNLICRDQEKLESFAALDEPRRPRATESPPEICRYCNNTGTAMVYDPPTDQDVPRDCRCQYGTQRRSA